MRIELACRYCKNVFYIPFSPRGLMLEYCPQCHSKIDRTDDEKLYNMTERAEFFHRQLNSVELKRIIADNCNVDDSPSDAKSVFYSDIENLSKIYNSSSTDVKEKMDSIIDKLYLLINDDAKKRRLDNLDSLYSVLEALFFKRIEKKQEEMKRFLLDGDD